MRRARQRAILDIVHERAIHSQAELVDALGEQGLSATQATVSRDVRQLGLVKIPLEEGGSRYAPPDERPAVSNGMDSLRGLAGSVTGVDEGEALLLIKTPIGHANAVAVALDACDLPEVAGTLAGDDTILLVLSRRVTEGEIDEVKQLLPAEIRDLWP